MYHHGTECRGGQPGSYYLPRTGLIETLNERVTTMATILQMPQRNKGRVRKSESFATMGECALNHLQADESNVERLSAHRADRVSNAEVSLLLSAVLFAGLSRTKQDSLTRQLKYLAPKDPRAAAALRIFARA
jgi:hypothetical protein